MAQTCHRLVDGYIDRNHESARVGKLHDMACSCAKGSEMPNHHGSQNARIPESCTRFSRPEPRLRMAAQGR